MSKNKRAERQSSGGNQQILCTNVALRRIGDGVMDGVYRAIIVQVTGAPQKG